MEDTIKLPLDADGVPIRPGDVVYVLFEQGRPVKVKAIKYDSSSITPWTIVTDKDQYIRFPKGLPHVKPETLEDIERDIAKGVKENEVPDRMERIKRMVER